MNNIYQNIQPFIQQVKNSNNIVIAGHISPDGDAICSSLSLAMTIEKMGKKVVVLLEDYGENYSYIKGHHLVYKQSYDNLDKIDLFICCDCGDLDRLGSAKSIFEKAKQTANIDHHISNNGFANLNIVNPNASSTSEVVFEIISRIGDIDFDIATAIYTGIVYDTSGFKHNCTTKRTHQIAGELVDLGIDTSFIHTDILDLHTIENSKLLAQAINNIYIEEDIIISTLTKQEIEKAGCSSKNTGGIIQHLINTKNINVAVFLYEKDEAIKASFRSKQLDVNKIASTFGGGGHILASGATITNMTIQQAKEDILQKIKNS